MDGWPGIFVTVGIVLVAFVVCGWAANVQYHMYSPALMPSVDCNNVKYDGTHYVLSNCNDGGLEFHVYSYLDKSYGGDVNDSNTK